MKGTDYQYLLGSQNCGVLLLTLNRPDKHNALNLELRNELEDALRRAQADPEVRVVALTGAGDRAFCAGQDLKESNNSVPITTDLEAKQGGGFRRALWECRKPVVAVINGLCLGAGLDLALFSDLRLAADNATFGYTEIRYGMIPGNGGMQQLARLTGLGTAMELSLTGRVISAKEALQCGLVTQVFPQENLLPEAIKLAKEMAGRAPMALRYVKEALNHAFELSRENAFALEAHLAALLRTTEDRAEGIRAFKEKRQPVFKGQ